MILGRARSVREAPLSQALGWVSPWGWFREIGSGKPKAGGRSRRSEATPEVGEQSRGAAACRSLGARDVRACSATVSGKSVWG